jgi:hypothetical protein
MKVRDEKRRRKNEERREYKRRVEKKRNRVKLLRSFFELTFLIDELRKRGWNEWGHWYTYKSLSIQWHEPVRKGK